MDKSLRWPAKTSDVVGNVIVKKSAYTVARIGGDGTGSTFGRYRFVNNTFVLASTSTIAMRLQYELESVELHNNVFYRVGGALTTLFRRSDPSARCPLSSAPTTGYPTSWTNTDVAANLSQSVQGTDPGLADGLSRTIVRALPRLCSTAELQTLRIPRPTPSEAVFRGTSFRRSASCSSPEPPLLLAP